MNIQNQPMAVNHSPSFQATLRIKPLVKDTKRLANIEKLFEQQTPHSPNTKLCAGFDNDKSEFFYLNSDKSTGFYFGEEMNKIMERCSDNEIVQKLVKVVKCLTEEKKWSAKSMGLQFDIMRMSKVANHNKTKAEALRNGGKGDIAKIYDVLATQNEGRVASLKRQREECGDTFVSKITKIADKDEDFDVYISAVTGL